MYLLRSLAAISNSSTCAAAAIDFCLVAQAFEEEGNFQAVLSARNSEDTLWGEILHKDYLLTGRDSGLWEKKLRGGEL